MIQNNNEVIILVKEELINSINALNENFNNQLIKMKQELKQENENKINEMKNIINKKDNELNDMKIKFDNIIVWYLYHQILFLKLFFYFTQYFSIFSLN